MIITIPDRDLRSVYVFMFQCQVNIMCQLVTLPPPLMKKCVSHLIWTVVHNHRIGLGHVSLAVDIILL